MRAVLLDRTPRRLRITDDWPEPEPGPGEVLVAVRGVGICGSDLALHAAKRQPPSFPWLVGHETFGEIVTAGPGTASPGTAGQGTAAGSAGQRVIIEPNIPCLDPATCRFCARGQTSACPRRAILGFTAPGTLTERIVVPSRFAWPVPDGWDEADAVCAEPFVVARTAIRRAWTTAADTRGKTLVLGAGSQGTMVCLGLIADGTEPAVIEPDPGRRKLAEHLGARAATPDETGFGLVFETSGAPEALTEAVRRAAPGGLIMLIGQSGEPGELVTRTVVQRQLTLMGSLIYDHPGDFAAALREPLPRPGQVLRTSYPITEAEQAFQAAREAPGKTWIRVDG